MAATCRHHDQGTGSHAAPAPVERPRSVIGSALAGNSCNSIASRNIHPDPKAHRAVGGPSFNAGSAYKRGARYKTTIAGTNRYSMMDVVRARRSAHPRYLRWHGAVPRVWRSTSTTAQCLYVCCMNDPDLTTALCCSRRDVSGADLSSGIDRGRPRHRKDFADMRTSGARVRIAGIVTRRATCPAAPIPLYVVGLSQCSAPGARFTI